MNTKNEVLKLALEAHQAMREWIDAVPDDTVLPTMPGCDRDWLDTVEAKLKQALAAQPAVPEGWKLVPAVPTNEWVNNLAKMQTGNLEEVPFLEIHQCIAELLAAAPEKGNTP
jgi:hypothetical protein